MLNTGGILSDSADDCRWTVDKKYDTVVLGTIVAPSVNNGMTHFQELAWCQHADNARNLNWEGHHVLTHDLDHTEVNISR